jgi:tetraacyldisaccharide 4'-kinase
LFRLVVFLRFLLYRFHLLSVERLPVPVIVVGNITVGGSGKTPLVLWLAEKLRSLGWQPGIISRGYRGENRSQREVMPDSDPLLVGDEPVLLARKSACPVWVGRNRAEAGRSLLKAHPACNLIISDDGLQHYRLARDVEIAVVDGERRFGNGFLLPAGPLREPVTRLVSFDAVVVNGGRGEVPDDAKAGFFMSLAGSEFYNLADPVKRAKPQDFVGQALHAVAGIGNPLRFFDHLRSLGLTVSEHPFPDHHVFNPGDLDFPGQILMTEKDGVKCAKFAKDNFWVLAVEAEVGEDLARLVAEKVRNRNG